MNKGYRKLKWQSIMENPEKQATLGTQDIGRRQTKEKNTTQKTKKMNPGAREWQAVPASYKTPIMFLT